jgi:hypothetical protein
VKKILNTVTKVIGWLVLLFAFASIGFATSNPKQGVPLYLLFFLVVFAGVYFYVARQKHTQENVTSKKNIFPRILGIVILIIAVLFPWFVFAKINLNSSVYILITAITALMIFVSIIAIRLINRSGKKVVLRIIGYLILIGISAIPAFAAINYFLQYFNRAYDALGTAYWCTVAIAVLSWWGFSLISKKN